MTLFNKIGGISLLVTPPHGRSEGKNHSGSCARNKTKKKSSRFEVSVQRKCRRIGVDNWQHSTLFFRFVIS
ncbi:hypothetical protein QHH03_31470, partial [Aphanizomenon sp. 202]|nr:hypothetical protein [Aphanizomenon sp. 202]